MEYQIMRAFVDISIAYHVIRSFRGAANIRAAISLFHQFDEVQKFGILFCVTVAVNGGIEITKITVSAILSFF